MTTTQLILFYKHNLNVLYEIILQKEKLGKCTKDVRKQYNVYLEWLKIKL